MSRFLQQIRYQHKLKPDITSLGFEIRNFRSISQTVERREEHTQRLLSIFAGDGSGKQRSVSPSAINTWLNCRMKFYYRYINGLEESPKISEEIDPVLLGTILHSAIRDLYSRFQGKEIDLKVIEYLLHDKHGIENIIINSIHRHFKRENDSIVAVNEVIIREVLIILIERILHIDKVATPFKIISFE